MLATAVQVSSTSEVPAEAVSDAGWSGTTTTVNVVVVASPLATAFFARTPSTYSVSEVRFVNV